MLAANGFLRSKLNPLLADIVKAFPGGDAELSDWCDELEQWVRWYRVPAYWLGFILQLVTQARGSIWHFRACALYADAQTSFADDYALSSLEVAYTDYARNQGALGPAFAPVRDALARRLLFYYTHYYTWSRPFEYMAGNPCADHLYTSLSHAWLEADTTDDDQPFDARNAEALSRIVREAGGDAFAFHRIVARRFLGLLHGGRGRHDLAAEHYHDALEEARRVQLDTEIGHLTRLLGGALRELGDLTEARHQFEQALAYEQLQPVAMYTMFWQALSASELGNTIVRAAGRPVVDTAVAAGQTAVRIDQPQVALEPALRAFRAARSLLSRHMSGQAPVPVARAGKQATFRSFSTNAIQAAALSQSVSDILGEVEVAGPRGVTELVAETSAVEEMNSDSLAAFRRNRAMSYSTLEYNAGQLRRVPVGYCCAQRGTTRVLEDGGGDHRTSGAGAVAGSHRAACAQSEAAAHGVPALSCRRANEPGRHPRP